MPRCGRFGGSVLAERDEVSVRSRGGFPFLLAFGSTWLVSASLALVLPVEEAALVFLFQGGVGVPLAFALEKVFGTGVPRDNPLTPLLVQVAMSQVPASLAAALIYLADPFYVPAGLAAIVGGHFLPYAWVHASKLYLLMGVCVAVVPFALVLALGENSFYLVGFAVGLALLCCAVVLRAKTAPA